MERKLADVKHQRDEMENEARGKVGLWSEYGLQAVRVSRAESDLLQE